jgi:hypothetical protein
MIRWQCYSLYCAGGAMPEFTTVSVTEAQLRTTSGRQTAFLHEYVDYITKLPKDQAGKLRIGEEEKPTTVRRRLVVAAKALGIQLMIRRSGNDVYFWREDREEEQPKTRRGRRPRMGSPGSLLPPQTVFSEPEAGEQRGAVEETTAPDQPRSASEEADHEALVEESPELGQTR